MNQLGYNKDLEQYPISDFKYTLYKVRDFYKTNLDQLGLLYFLDQQIKAQEDSIDDYNKLDNNRPMILKPII